jgi:cytochrome c556
MPSLKKCLLLIAAACLAPVAIAGDDPAEERHERMEEVGDAVGPIGGMLKGELEFDSVIVMANLMTIKEATTGVEDLFPEGSYVEGEKRATRAVWTHRADFDQKLADFNVALDAAIEAQPQTIDELKPVFTNLIDTCKACHEDYRSAGD